MDLNFENTILIPPNHSWWASWMAQWFKESSCNTRDTALISGLERFPGGANGNPFHYSCLENSIDSGVWEATVLGATKGWTQLNK